MLDYEGDPRSQDAVAHDINVVPMNFRKDFIPDRDNPGELKEIHWVDLVKRGSHGESTPWKIKELEQNELLWRFVQPFYERWLEGQEDPVDGTPLDQCAFIPPGLAEHLRSLQIKTAEDLANIPDSDLERVGMGARGWRKKAQAYVESKKDGELAVVNAQLKEETEHLRKEVAEMRAQLNALTDKSDKPDPEKKAA